MFKREKINGNGRWVKLVWVDEDLGLVHKIKAKAAWMMNAYVLWRFYAVKRNIKNLPKLWRLYWKCKKINKQLLEEVKNRQNEPQYTPPTREEVLDFISWAEENGMNFKTRVQPIPKVPPSSKEIWL